MRALCYVNPVTLSWLKNYRARNDFYKFRALGGRSNELRVPVLNLLRVGFYRTQQDPSISNASLISLTNSSSSPFQIPSNPTNTSANDFIPNRSVMKLRIHSVDQ